VDLSTGPPAPALQSKLGVPRERRPLGDAELQARRHQSELSAKAYQEARAACLSTQGRSKVTSIPFAGEELGQEAEVTNPVPGVLKERNRSRPASREVEEVKADAEKTMLLRDIEMAAAELREDEEAAAALAALREMEGAAAAAAALQEVDARASRKQESKSAQIWDPSFGSDSPRSAEARQGSDAADAYRAAREVAARCRSRNQCASGLFDAAGDVQRPQLQRNLKPQQDSGYAAAGLVAHKDAAGAEIIFGKGAQLSKPPPREERPNIITWG